MSRFWPFRSLTNFSLTVLGCCGVGFYGYGIYKQQFFSNPVVSQAVKILGKNQKIKQMIGYPLSYQSSTRNKFNQQGNQLYYNFKVMGPRGSTQVQVTATHIKAKQVYQYDKKNQTIINTENKIKELQSQINSIDSKIKLAKKKQKQNYLSMKNEKLLELQNETNKFNLIKQQKNKLKNQYYIPQKQYYSDIVTQSGKNSDNFIPQESLLYKIQNVACQLPNKSRISIVNGGNVVKSSQKDDKKQQQIKLQNYSKPLYGKLHEKLSVNLSDLSQEQIQQYGKHKTNFMYQKYGMYRTMAIVAVMIAAGTMVIYFGKNKTKNMTNSVLYKLTQTRIFKNPKILQYLRQNNLSTLQLNKIVGGGMKGNTFNCQISVNNVSMGQIIFRGKHIPKQGKYQFDTFLFKYNDKNNKTVEIDLLK